MLYNEKMNPMARLAVLVLFLLAATAVPLYAAHAFSNICGDCSESSQNFDFLSPFPFYEFYDYNLNFGGGDGGGGSFTPYCTLAAAPSTLVGSGSTTLSWSAPYATAGSINQGVGSLATPTAGSAVVPVSNTTNYTATFSTPYGSATCSTSVTVSQTPPPPSYGPYCGDGVVNQTWEQCDGGAQCTAQCQTVGQCVAMSFARITITDVQNIERGSGTNGSVTSDLFLGSASNRIPQGTWFPVFAGGSAITDSDLAAYADVPGLAVQRMAGKIRVLLYGSYPQQPRVPPLEHLEGTIEFFQGVATGQVVDTSVNSVLENDAFDGQKFVGARGDELWLSGGKSYFWISVDTANDAFFTTYTAQPAQCNLPPVCTLSASPQSIGQGGSSSLLWTTTNATSFSVNQGVGSVAPVAAGSTTVSPSTTTTYTGTATGPGGSTQCSTTVTVVPPIDACGIDLALVLDVSGSIDQNELAQMKGAVVPFVNGFGSDTQFSLTSFFRTATVHLGFTANKTAVVNAVNNLQIGNLTGTNWDDALLKASSTYDPRPSAPNVILFASDGKPNTFGIAGSAPQNPTTMALNAAISRANTIKTGGTRIVALGIGNQNASNLQAIASTGDYYTTANFATLADELQNLSEELCSVGTITVQKIVDVDGNISTTNDQTVASGWSYTIDAMTATTGSNGHTNPATVGAGSHTVTESLQSGYTVVGAGCSGAVSNGTWSGSSISGIVTDTHSQVLCTFYNKPPQNAPTCAMSLSPTSVSQGGTSTLTWSTTNVTSAQINQGIGSVAVQGSQSVVATTTTTYSGTFSGPGGTVTCNATLSVSTPGPQCTISLSRSTIKTGESVDVSWTSVNSTNGFITGGVGTTSPVSGGSVTVYPSDDTNFVGTFSGPYGTTTCSAFVDVQTGGGGCTSGCGGGLDQPNVSLLSKPGDAPLAFVSLAQIPYTGFEAGPALTAAFWLSVAVLAALATYTVMGRGGMQFVLQSALGAVSIPIRDSAELPRTVPNSIPHAESGANGYHASVATAPSAAAPLQKNATDGIPDLAEVVEARAHAAGVLMSPEAVERVLRLAILRGEVLQRFGDILNKAVQTIPREDGWILLTSEHVEQLAGASPAPQPLATAASTPTVEEILASVMTHPSDELKPIAARPVELPMTEGDHQALAMNLARAILGGNREQAYQTARTLESSGANAASVMTVIMAAFDQLYRARRHGSASELAAAAAHLSDAAVQGAVEAFAHGMDHGYTNPYTGLRLAVAQAFERVG